MIKLTKIDGHEIHINHCNIQWIEALPDTTITILSGARIIVKESIENVLHIIDARISYENNIILNYKFDAYKTSNENLPGMT